MLTIKECTALIEGISDSLIITVDNGIAAIEPILK